MKLKNGDLFLCKEPLKRLVERDDIPIKYGLPIARLARKLGEEIDLIDQKREGLIRKYGEQKDKNVSITPESTNWEKFVNEFNELIEIEVEVNVKPVKIPGDTIIPEKDLLSLMPFLEVEDEGKV